MTIGSMVNIGETQTARVSFTESDVFQFANIVGDRNKLHMDAVYAESARFGERIVHGTLVEGVISAALASFDGDVIYLDKQISFVNPVYLGDTVIASAEVVEKEGKVHTCEVDASVNGTTSIEGRETVMIE